MKNNKEIIAVDLGGTNLRIALIKNNKILKFIRKKTPKNKKKILDELTDSIQELMNKNVKGIGISYAGMIEYEIIKKSPNLPFKNFDLRKYLQKKFPKKIIKIENDANCVALAEAKLGAGKKKKNFFILTLGTGIGGGIIINEQLYKGNGYAGELGHILLDNEKDFESLSAGKAVKRLSKKYYEKKFSVQELVKINDSSSKKILNEISKYLGQGISNLITIFDPEIVILAGGITHGGKPFLNLIKKQTEKYMFLPRKVPIEYTKLKHAGILGAGLLIE